MIIRKEWQMGRKRNFIFTNRRHSHKAIMGTILGLISLISLGIVIYLSYQSGGVIPAGYGLTGFLALIFSVIGLVLGILDLAGRENFRFFPILALLFNGTVLLFLGALLYTGI